MIEEYTASTEEQENNTGTEQEIVLSPGTQVLCDRLLVELHETRKMPPKLHEVYGLPRDERRKVLRILNRAVDELQVEE